MTKYHNIKTTIDGITFDSMLEAQRWCELRLLERAGEIKNLQRQVVFELQPSYRKNGKTIRPINYIADFVYEEDGGLIVEDTKGFRTQEYMLKKKLFEYRYPHTIKEVRKCSSKARR